jgi:hypothetical protein
MKGEQSRQVVILVRFATSRAMRSLSRFLLALLGSCDDEGGQRFSQVGDERGSHHHA